MYTDSHCHLSFLDTEIALKTIEAGQKRGISRWVMAGYDLEDWRRQSLLQQRAGASVCAAYGIHPWVVISQTVDQVGALFKALEDLNPSSRVAGEMGLDFHNSKGPECRSLQEEYFRKQLEFAQKRPCVLHVVKAHGAALNILDEFPESRGWVHGFSGSWEVAQDYLKRGFFISVGRSASSKNFIKLKDVIQKIEVKDLLIESDSPAGPKVLEAPDEIYFEGAKAVAEIKNISVHDLLVACHRNMSEVLDDH